MKTAVEPLENNKVKLSIEVEEAEFEKAIDAAFRRIATEVRIPGFRPGKAPRRLLEARIGSETARDEALRSSVPGYYAEALREHELDAIAPPEIDITSGKEGGPVAFDAVVELRPQVNVGGYDRLRVTVPSPEPSAEEIQLGLDRLREQFAELQAVARPAREGDHLTIDISGRRHDEAVEGLTAEDYLYELGSASIAPELDKELSGARTGDILKFNATVAEAGEVTFQVLVKEVREKVLPEITDEWATEASEFETVEELRRSIGDKLRTMKAVQTSFAFREAVVDALVALVEDPAPGPLVQEAMEHKLEDMNSRLESRGADIPAYLQANDISQEDLLGDVKKAAERSVLADLALRAVAEAEGLDASEEQLEKETNELAERAGVTPAEARRRLERADQLPAVRSEIKKANALKWLLEHTEIADEDGQPIERSQLLGAAPGDSPEPDDEPAKETVE